MTEETSKCEDNSVEFVCPEEWGQREKKKKEKSKEPQRPKGQHPQEKIMSWEIPREEGGQSRAKIN